MTAAPTITEGRVNTSRLGLHVVRSIPVRTEGRVLLLGGSNFDLRLKREFLDSAIARCFEIVTFEPRGIGRSDSPDGTWTMEDYARDAVSLLDALGWASVDVLGESFGGMTALHMAHLFPERVARMALASATAGGAGGGSVDISCLLELPRPAAAAAALMLLDAENHALRETDPAAFERRAAARLAFEAAFAEPSVANGGYRRLLAARAGHDIWDDLPGIAHETLVITGSRDRQALPEAQKAMAARLPNAVQRVYDSGHGVAFATAQPMRDLQAHWTIATPRECLEQG